ncbi:Trehalase [Nocardioides scoriae]|uniref:Trehalase n=1 Tax=Nocardioides scoriae TaxID=642780 RepID=A0A1H1U6I7_9ACTN|nr:trehalase family glycosidase [Nocardioides scoriae]SDS68024.1 Trehalase [Nocardioides scoriae]
MSGTADLRLDLAQVPFSRAGSWLDLSPVAGQHDVRDQVHLVSHVQGMHAVLELVPVTASGPVAHEVGADPAVLTWTAAEGRVRAVFAGDDVVRFRGEGLGLRVAAAAPELTPFSGTYLVEEPVSGTVVLTSYETGRRYRVGVEVGDVVVEGAQRTGRCARSVTVLPDGTGVAELWVQELPGEAPRWRPARSFEDERAAVADELAAYVARVAGWRTDRTPAAAAAVHLLWSATVAPSGYVGTDAVLMSMNWMDKVWSWDHCFNALALAEGDPALAWQQLRLPFAHQDEHGALPDSVTQSEVLRNFVKPPVHGWALQSLLARVAERPDPAVLAEVLDELAAWTTWWTTRRTAPGRRLPHYQHGNDSGWDNATVFAEEQLLETADLAAFLAVQAQVVADLASELGRDEQARHWSARADVLVEGLVEELWDGEQLVSRAVVSGARRRTRSLQPLLALLLGERLPAAVREALVARLDDHLTEHGLATEPVGSAAYEPDGYWRGPIWAPSTVLVVEGLRRCGHDGLADDVARRFLRLCERSGFAENFDAVTGEGLRDRAYTWTASAYLLLARDAGAPAR